MVVQSTARDIDIFTEAQVERLKKPLDAARVKQRKGYGDDSGGGKMLSYVESHDVIDMLNEIFGFGRWGYAVKSRQRCREGDALWYEADVHLWIWSATSERVDREDVGFGIVSYSRTNGPDSARPESFEKAAKEAVSDGLKRCARTFGNAFGNSLYDKADMLGTGATQTPPATQARPPQQQQAPRPTGPRNAPAPTPPAPAKLSVVPPPPPKPANGAQGNDIGWKDILEAWKSQGAEEKSVQDWARRYIKLRFGMDSGKTLTADQMQRLYQAALNGEEISGDGTSIVSHQTGEVTWEAI